MKVTFKNKKVHDYKDATWKQQVGNAIHMMKTEVDPRTNDRKAVCVAVVNSSEVASIDDDEAATILSPPAEPTVEPQNPEAKPEKQND